MVLNLGEISLPFVTSQEDQWPELDVWKTEKWNKLIRSADKLEWENAGGVNILHNWGPETLSHFKFFNN